MTIKEIHKKTDGGKLLRTKTIFLSIEGIDRKIELKFVGLHYVYALGDDGKWHSYHPKHIKQIFII